MNGLYLGAREAAVAGGGRLEGPWGRARRGRVEPTGIALVGWADLVVIPATTQPVTPGTCGVDEAEDVVRCK